MTPTLTVLLAEQIADPAPDGGAKVAARRVPKPELHLLQYGTNETDYGPFEFTPEDGASLMAWYQEKYAARDGWIDMDREHVTWSDDAASDDFDSCGRFRLALRDDGLWAVECTYQPEIYDKIAADKIRSFSVVVDFDATRHVIALRHLGLTNRPAAYGAGLLAAAVSGFLKYPLMEGAWDGAAADKRIRAKLSSDGTGALDKVDMARYRACHVFYNAEKPESVSEYKGLICDVEDDTIKLHRGAIQALAAAMRGSRGGIDVSSDDMDKGRRLLSRYYKLWDAVAPWDKEEQQMAEKSLKELIGASRIAMLIEGGYQEKMVKARQMIQALKGDDTYIRDMNDTEIEFCDYSNDQERIFRVPYTMTDNSMSLGDAVELVLMPKVETVQMTERANKAEDSATKTQAALAEVLKATGCDSATAAITHVQALTEAQGKVAKLTERLSVLESDRSTREKTAILSDAKATGRWTKDLETRGDEVWKLAERLGEDPVNEYRRHWAAAPSITGGTTETQRQQPGDALAKLTEADRKAAKELAPRLGMTEQALLESMAARK